MEDNNNLQWASNIHPAITMRNLWEPMIRHVRIEVPEFTEILEIINPEKQVAHMHRTSFVEMVEKLSTREIPQRFRNKKLYQSHHLTGSKSI